MSQRNRSGRGHNRNNGADHGEEAQLWESAKEKYGELVASINADSDNLADLLDADRCAARVQRLEARLPTDELGRLEGLCRSGVSLSNANSALIKALIEQLTVLRGVQSAKEAVPESITPVLGSVATTAAAVTAAVTTTTTTTTATIATTITTSTFATATTTFVVAVSAAAPAPAAFGRTGGPRSARDRDRENQTTAVLCDIDATSESPAPSSIASMSRGRTGTNRDSAPVKLDVSAEPLEPSTAPIAASAGAAAASATPAALPTPAAAGPGPGIVAAAAAGSGAGTPVLAAGGIRGRITFARGDEVAFRPKAEQTSDWILGEVAQVMGEGKSRRYKVLDVEPEDPAKQKEYRSSASSMIAITPDGPAAAALLPWEPGKIVLALYPQTTTFYKAEVVGTAANGRVDLRFEGENDSRTILQVERRFVIENRL